MSDSKRTFHCIQCYQRQHTTVKAFVKRREITRVHKDNGVFKAAVCGRCGGLYKPFLKRIDNE